MDITASSVAVIFSPLRMNAFDEAGSHFVSLLQYREELFPFAYNRSWVRDHESE